MLELKAQLTIEYLASFITFIGLIIFIYFTYSGNIPEFIEEVKKEDVRSKAYQLSETLVNNPGDPPNWDDFGYFGMDVMMVIDISDSMSGQRIQAAKDGVIAFMDEMDFTKDQIGIAAFCQTGSLEQGLTNDQMDVETALTGLSLCGGTNLGEGIRKAKEELIDYGRVDSVHVIITLTDGASNAYDPDGIDPSEGTFCAYQQSHTCFDDSDNVEDYECYQYARDQGTDVKNNYGITIFTIGLEIDQLCQTGGGETGRQLIRDLLIDIASKDEYFKEAATSDVLEKIYTKIAEMIVSEIKRIGLSDENFNKTNLISLDKVERLDQTDLCGNFDDVKKWLGLNKSFSIYVFNISLSKGNRDELCKCTSPELIKTAINTTVRRVTAINNNGRMELAEILVQM